MNADGTDKKQITNDGLGTFQLSWGMSPSGSKIAYAGVRAPEGWGMFTINPDGSGLTRLTGVPSAPAFRLTGPIDWSPDGTKIVFSSESPLINGCGISVDPEDIYVYTVLTNTTVKVSNTSAWEGPHEFSPAWSPDGSKIAFSAVVRACDNGRATSTAEAIYSMNADAAESPSSPTHRSSTGGVRNPPNVRRLSGLAALPCGNERVHIRLTTATTTATAVAVDHIRSTREQGLWRSRLHRYGICELGFGRQLRNERKLHRQRSGGPLEGCGFVHGDGVTAREHELLRCTARVTDVLDREGRSDDHVPSARREDVRGCGLHDQRERVVRTARFLLDERDLHDHRIDCAPRRARILYCDGVTTRRRELQRCAGRRAYLRDRAQGRTEAAGSMHGATSRRQAPRRGQAGDQTGKLLRRNNAIRLLEQSEEGRRHRAKPFAPEGSTRRLEDQPSRQPRTETMSLVPRRRQ
jgi:WD40-like Beta Propeller Repeat